MPLNDATIRSAKAGERDRKLSDGGGLYVLVTRSGSRLWRMNYRFAGKQKTLAFGVYPTISLADARSRRDAAKRLLSTGIDPADDVRQVKVATLTKAGNTFGGIADEYVEKLKREGRADATMAKVEWLLDFARPALGSRPVADISAADVLAVIRRVEARGRLETARRLRSTIGAVIRYAIATARAENDPTFALRGALVSPKVASRAAVTDPVAFGGLLRSIETFEGQPSTHAALRLMALLFPRPGELRMAEWPEFDLDAAVWTIPAPRTKMRREHRKPLPIQAVVILHNLHAITGDHPLVFPSVRTWRRPISENTLNAALRRLGYGKDEATAHGFRASASTLLNESGKWNPDAIEREQGRIEANEIRRAYARGQHWDERVEMMQCWADYCDLMRGGAEIIRLGKRSN